MSDANQCICSYQSQYSESLHRFLKSQINFSLQSVEVYRLFIQLESKTSLFAHHPEKKIIKKIMDRRPKKHRLSDINRKNINLDKCITKIPNAPADYTIISAAGK